MDPSKMGGAGGGGMPDMSQMMGGMQGNDSDDEEGEESNVNPHKEGIDDLDQEAEPDNKKE